MDTGETIFKFENGESRKSLLSEEGEIRTDDPPKKSTVLPTMLFVKVIAGY